MRILLLLCVAMALLVAGCDEAPPADPQPEPPEPVGGGPHVITHIGFVPQEPGLMQVGETVQLKVYATWGFPYENDVTREAAIKLTPADMGELKKDGSFIAHKIGVAHFEASLHNEFTKGKTLEASLDVTIKEFIQREPRPVEGKSDAWDPESGW